MNERSHTTRLLLQRRDGNRVGESALQEITVSEARETSNAVGDHVVGSPCTHTKEFTRHRNVAVGRTAPHETRSLGRHNSESYFDVVMTFSRAQGYVMKGTFGQREGKPRVRTGRSAPFSPTRARSAEQSWFLGSADFRCFGGHRGAHGAGR